MCVRVCASGAGYVWGQCDSGEVSSRNDRLVQGEGGIASSISS